MKEFTAIVIHGQVLLPPSVKIPDGTAVRVLWSEGEESTRPYDREVLEAEDVEADLTWATGKRFSS